MNIFGIAPDIQNRKEMWSTAITPAFRKKSPVNFGPQTKKLYWLELSHPTGVFGDNTFRPLGGVAPSVLYALEIDQVLIAHTQMGDEGPPPLQKKNFWSWKFIIWPKI